MRKIHLLLLLLLTSNQRVVIALKSGKYCFSGCELSIDYVSFNDTSLASKKAASCYSKLRATSMYLCIDEYCSAGGRKEWLRSTNETCQRVADTSMPPYGIVAEYGPDARAALRRLSVDEAFAHPILGEVWLPDELFFARAFETLDAAFYEYKIHLVYGWAMLYFWAIVFSIGIGSRLLSLVHGMTHAERHQIPRAPDEPELSGRPDASAMISVLWKRHITVPATFNNRCSQPIGWCTIPPRIQSLTIISFVVLNIILCTIDYRITHGNLYWPQEYIQLWRYVSDRTGIISLANFPIIWIFGMRNNVLMWATGWGFGTYNSFHRWVARVSTVQAVVHSVGYTVMVCERGGWTNFKKYLGKQYFWNGELATTFMCALLAFSFYRFRRSHYESFLVAHIVFSIVVLLTMHCHVQIFTDGEWNIFIYPCLAVWGLDRFLRILRILILNPQFWDTKAKAAYDASSNLVRLEVPFRKSYFEPKPGTYYYIYVLDNPLYAHQNHPFTLAYVRPSNTPRKQDMRRLLLRRPSPHTESDPLLPLMTSSSASPSLVFLIRPYNGFTSRLVQKASAGPISLRVLVEGPYGFTAPLQQYPNILFVVGGTGITVPLSHLANLLSDDSAVATMRITWAVREHAFLAGLLDEFRGLLEDERVYLEVHVTRDEENKDDVVEEELKRVRIKAGRPDVHAVVEDAAVEAGHERLAIMACGPGQMVDQVRKATVDMLGKGFRGVDYFEESFKW